MCLILLAYRARPDVPLLFAANRDEFFDRPTAPAAFWPDEPHVLAGRDLRAGGTWMGISRDGRWAAVTNVRGAEPDRRELRSRGHLVSGFLRGDPPARDYLGDLVADADEYAGFNLLVGDHTGVYYFGNRGGDPRELAPGIYGLSNHLLDTPWPKVERGKRALSRVVDSAAAPRPESLLEILYDSEIAPDHQLPDTGLGRELERRASAPFIVDTEYGTRSSTALVIRDSGVATFLERTFLPGPTQGGDVLEEFALG